MPLFNANLYLHPRSIHSCWTLFQQIFPVISLILKPFDCTSSHYCPVSLLIFEAKCHRSFLKSGSSYAAHILINPLKLYLNQYSIEMLAKVTKGLHVLNPVVNSVFTVVNTSAGFETIYHFLLQWFPAYCTSSYISSISWELRSLHCCFLLSAQSPEVPSPGLLLS